MLICCYQYQMHPILHFRIRELASQHYAEHEGKSFYPRLIDFITSGPVVAMVWQGENAITLVRRLLGATSPENAETGSIRGDYAMTTSYNLMHASDGPESAAQEIRLYFTEEEIQDYKLTIDTWLG